jgi:protein SCO1/2
MAQTHPAHGIVVQFDARHGSLVVSCDAIPGYMSAMEMPFRVHDAVKTEIQAGATIDFNIVERDHVLYAEKIRVAAAENFESEPMSAGSLAALHNALNPAAAQVLAQGQKVPDFALTDQAGARVHLAGLEGKVVLLTFGYSRCPNPDYCYRLSHNLEAVEKRFAARAGRDLLLLTIAIDPEHDQGEVLTQYAAVFHADPAVWHFLSGPLPEVKQLAGMFGMNFWSREGLVTHTLHTVIIDREGRLAANLEGNRFSAQQLGDLVEKVMNRPR